MLGLQLHLMLTAIKLRDFVQEYNNDQLLISNTGDSDSTEQPVYHDGQPDYGMRPSSIGQPAIISVYSAFIGSLIPKFVPVRPLAIPYGRRQDLFNVGHSTEARLLKVLTDYGFKVDAHVPNSISPLLSGTCDAVLDNTLLVDVKTAASANFKRYSSELPAKYTAQLAVYKKGLEQQEQYKHLTACVLMYNKDNSELQIVAPKSNELDKALDRANLIVNITQGLLDLSSTGAPLADCIEYISDNVQYMPLRAEVYNGEETGNLLVPPDLQYNPWLIHLLYETHTTPNNRKKLTTYITRELETDEIAEMIRKMLRLLNL